MDVPKVRTGLEKLRFHVRWARVPDTRSHEWTADTHPCLLHAHQRMGAWLKVPAVSASGVRKCSVVRMCGGQLERGLLVKARLPMLTTDMQFGTDLALHSELAGNAGAPEHQLHLLVCCPQRNYKRLTMRQNSVKSSHMRGGRGRAPYRTVATPVHQQVSSAAARKQEAL